MLCEQPAAVSRGVEHRMLSGLSRFISVLVPASTKEDLNEVSMFGFLLGLGKPYWWSLSICASSSAFRHGLYHPQELLEQVKGH